MVHADDVKDLCLTQWKKGVQYIYVSFIDESKMKLTITTIAILKIMKFTFLNFKFIFLF